MMNDYSSEYKMMMVIESLKKGNSVAKIALRENIPPHFLEEWKRIFMEKGKEVFNKGQDGEKRKEFEKEEKRLKKKVERLKVERDFLRKKHKELYGEEPEKPT